MPHQATLIGGYLLRLSHDAGRLRIQLRDLRRGEVLEFETWVAAWAYVDQVINDFEARQHPKEESK